MSVLRLGMIGLDTSHVSAFAKTLNDESAPHHIPGGRITAAVRAGNADLPVSANRLDKFTEELTGKYGVKLYESIAEMAGEVDAVMIESVDGSQHADQFAQLAGAGKPVFIDKPLSCGVSDALKIAALSRGTGTPVMSCSAIRYAAGIADLHDGSRAFSCEAFGPANVQEGYPWLFWYGVHTADVLFSFMGKGVRTVRTISGEQSDLVTGQWADGRVGNLRCFRNGAFKRFGCCLFTDSEPRTALAASEPPYYALMLQRVMEFFRTGVAPIDLDETLEIVAFLEAGNRSKELGGQPVDIHLE